MDEARALRLHKQRLEHRRRILEQQNEQLELQLQRLKKMIDQQRENSSRFDSTSAERDWAVETPTTTQQNGAGQVIDWTAAGGENGGGDSSSRRQTRMHSLLATVGDLGRAMENIIVSVVYDSEPDD